MKTMTNEERNIAICEWLGWKPYSGDRSKMHEHLRTVPMWEKDGETTPEGWDCHQAHDLPQHIEGIEALGNIHEAEKEAHKQGLWQSYLAELWKEVNKGREISACHPYQLFFVGNGPRHRNPASQRPPARSAA